MGIKLHYEAGESGPLFLTHLSFSWKTRWLLCVIQMKSKRTKTLSMLLLLACLVCHLKKPTKGDNKPSQLFHSNYSPCDSATLR